MKLRVLDILRGTTVDGPGFRTAIYLSGCHHQCPGCHNPQSWDESAGTEMELSEIMKIVEEEDFDVTLTGGDPLLHPESCAALAKEIVDAGYKVWLYTGYTWEEIMALEALQKPLPYIEAAVEGRFMQQLRDTNLLFRGSSNQRIIDVKESLAQGKAVQHRCIKDFENYDAGIVAKS